MLHTPALALPANYAAQAFVEGTTKSIAERMAAIMVDKAGDGCHLGHLLDGGIPANEVECNLEEARKIARGLSVRDVAPVYDRAKRISVAANSILSLMPETVAITLHLMAREFPKSELDDILADALAQAAKMFAGEGRAQ